MGVVFRHYGASNREQRALAVAKIAKERRLWLSVAGDVALAHLCGANGLHLPQYLGFQTSRGDVARWRQHFFVTMAVHDAKALGRAQQIGVDAVIMSPILATQSHVGAKYLGLIRARAWTKQAKLPVFWLGGLAPQKFTKLQSHAYGMAGIGGLIP